MAQALFIMTAAVLVFIAQSCGKDDDKKPDPNVKRVQIGTPAISGHTYSWTPADSLDNPNSAQPMASPKKTTIYTVTAQTKCGSSTSKTTVHVYKQNEYGELVEVL